MSKYFRLALVPLLLLAVTVPAEAKDTPRTPVEHVAVVRNLSDAHRIHLPDQLLHGSQLSTSTTRVWRAGVAAPAQASVAPFLTRPYWNHHDVISVFDHCNPDYSLDGKICEVDGTVAKSSNGSDPTFPPGYAVTPGGTDYLYYDGHNGWDIGLNYEPLIAACPGTVTTAGVDPNNAGFGETVVIDCGNGFSIRYGHMSQIVVTAGQHVQRAQSVGTSGNTGYSTGPHLHFGVYLNSNWDAIDPWGWAGSYPDPWPADAGNLWITGNPQNPTPLAPTNAQATAAGSRVQVAWTPPSFTGGDPITSYAVTSSPGNVTTTVPGSQTSAIVSGLTTGTSYTFTVTAATDIGSSPASAPSNPAMPRAINGLGGQFSAPASVTAWEPGGADVFVTGNDHALWHDWSDPYSWHGWQSLGGYLTSNVASVQTHGALYAIARGRDNGLWYVAWDGTNWSGWVPLGGIATSDPTIVSADGHRVDVFVRGIDRAVWTRGYDGTTWSPWQSLGGVVSGNVHVTSLGAGTLDAFVLGGDHGYWQISFRNGSWGWWAWLGGPFSSDPAPVVYAPGLIEIFGRGTDQGLWHSWMVGSNWSSWQSLGGVLTSAPTVTADPNYHVDVFSTGLDGDLWHIGHREYTGWPAWNAIGGAWTPVFGAGAVAAGMVDVVDVWPDSSMGEVDYTF